MVGGVDSLSFLPLFVVTFYKRAQILIADLWLAFKGKSYGHFEDIDSLTAFADYRQVMPDIFHAAP